MQLSDLCFKLTYCTDDQYAMYGLGWQVVTIIVTFIFMVTSFVQGQTPPKALRSTVWAQFQEYKVIK